MQGDLVVPGPAPRLECGEGVSQQSLCLVISVQVHQDRGEGSPVRGEGQQIRLGKRLADFEAPPGVFISPLLVAPLAGKRTEVAQDRDDVGRGHLAVPRIDGQRTTVVALAVGGPAQVLTEVSRGQRHFCRISLHVHGLIVERPTRTINTSSPARRAVR